ncbi:MAG: hypothetical protein ACI4T5_02485 [Prevotella sp.]
MKKQREVRVKTYAVDGMSEAVYQIHYGRGHCLELRLSNGTKTQYGMKPAIYMSGNVIEQAIIENSELFKNGTVYVLRESEKGEKIEVEVRGKDDEAQTIGENGKAGDTGMPGRDGKPGGNGGNGKTESSATKSPRTVAEGKARLAPDSASTGAEDTGTEGTSNESGEAEGTGNKSGEAEGTGNKSGEAEGTGAEGDEAEGTGAEGGEAEGTGAEGDEAEGSESAGLVFEDLASAQDYLIERYGVKRTEIRSKKAVVELGKSRGVSVTIKD